LSDSKKIIKVNEKQIIIFYDFGDFGDFLPILSYGIINTMVSLKYEANKISDCISLVNG
jgi:hypothetical protein